MDDPGRRSRAEFIPGVGWVRDGRRVRVDKPYYNIVWPRDRRSTSSSGRRRSRWKDIITGRGPDMFLSITSTPTAEPIPRARWSRWTQFDPLMEDHSLQPLWPVAVFRRPGKVYDFRKRRYRWPRPWSWSDVDEDRGLVRDAWGYWGFPDRNGWVGGFGEPDF